MDITERIQQIADTVAEIRGDVRVIMERLSQKPNRTEVVDLIKEHMSECPKQSGTMSADAWRSLRYLAYAAAIMASALLAALGGKVIQ